MELYIHIPFCIKKCDYCDFLSGPADSKTKEKYVEALIKEIEASKLSKDKENIITSVFVGGGTPSILECSQIKRILDAVKNTFIFKEGAEITVEMNPGTVTKEKLLTLKEAGVNRLSIGLQSADDKELKILGRIHTYNVFLNSYEMAREAGFDNINVDLISAVPGQSVSSWRNTLKKVAELNPEHISAYSLIIEEGTPFYEKYGEDNCNDLNESNHNDSLPDEVSERLMYEETEEILSAYGYHRYEISNYSKDGKECVHNKGYWKCQDYIGLGLGASSLVNGKRFHNTEDMSNYIENSFKPKSIKEDVITLSIEEKIEEFMFLGLRMTKGISLDEFKKRFGIDIKNVYAKEIEQFKEEGFMDLKDGRVFLTKQGVDVSNQIFVEFMEPEVNIM